MTVFLVTSNKNMYIDNNPQEQFYQMMTNLRRSNSRAASTQEAERITEVHDGIIVTRPLKKVEYISDSEPKNTEQQGQAQVWNLTKDGPVFESKAASVNGINKLREIIKFQMSNGRI